MSDWRQNERPPGMSDFARWYRPEGVPGAKHMADIDGILHDGGLIESTGERRNRFWMFEFKPPGVDVPQGQQITLAGFSQMPNCWATVVYDPMWSTRAGVRYPDNLEISIIHFTNGRPIGRTTTIGMLNKRISSFLKGGIL